MPKFEQSSIEKEIIGRRRTVEKNRKATENLKKESRTDTEGMVDLIKNYIQRDMGSSRLFTKMPETEGEAREFFLKLESSDFEKILKKKGLKLSAEIISQREILKNKIREGIEKEGLWEDLEVFVKEKPNMLPFRLKETYNRLYGSREELANFFFLIFQREKEKKEFFLGPLKTKLEILRDRLKKDILLALREENGEWEKYPKYEREEKIKPAEIKGFEKFDFYTKKGEKIAGKEILKMAAGILPRGTSMENVKTIEYIDEERPISEEYGIDGSTGAGYSPLEEKIAFYKKDNKDLPEPYRESYRYLDFLKYLRMRLIHEDIHSLDPRVKDQKDIPPAIQFKIIRDWEKIREEEPIEITSYVKEINNKDKKEEDFLKSKEDLTESGTMLLTNPNKLSDKAPKRFKFVKELLERHFPEFRFTPEEQIKKEREYQNFIFPMLIYYASQKRGVYPPASAA